MQFGEYVTVSEAARLTNQTFWQVKRLIQKKSIPVARAGNTLLIRLEDVKNATKDR
jgi:excisionase family DNA binding protein